MKKHGGYAIPNALYKNVLYSVDDAINVFHKTKLGQFTCPKCGDPVTLVCSDERQYFCHAQWGKDHYFCESYSGFREYQSLKIVRSKLMQERNNWVSYFIYIEKDKISNYVSLPSITGNLTKINFKTGLKEYILNDSYIDSKAYEINLNKIELHIIYKDKNLPIFLECDYRKSIFVYTNSKDKFLFKKIVGKLKTGRKYIVFCDKKVTFNNGITATLLSEINNKFIYEIEFVEKNAWTESYAEARDCMITEEKSNTSQAINILMYFWNNQFNKKEVKLIPIPPKKPTEEVVSTENPKKVKEIVTKEMLIAILNRIEFYHTGDNPIKFKYRFETGFIRIFNKKNTMFHIYPETLLRVKKMKKISFRQYTIVYNENPKPKLNSKQKKKKKKKANQVKQ